MVSKVSRKARWEEMQVLRDKGFTYDAIGVRYGISRQCVQQGLSREYKKLRCHRQAEATAIEKAEKLLLANGYTVTQNEVQKRAYEVYCGKEG